jgi:agmatine/peptidylarginine deiminase
MLRITLLMVLTSCLMYLSAQESTLPHFMTDAEQQAMADYLKTHHANTLRSVPNPPPGQVRTIAEWEPIQALVITWTGQQTILREIVRNAVKECRVLIITNNPDNVSSALIGAGIALDSVEFVNTPFNSIWVRDYGPWGVYKNDVDSLALVDWIYNRPRQNDDASPIAVAAHLNLPIYEATVAPFDWVHTGGNHLLDGMGTVFSSNLVLEENPEKTEAQIDSIANMFLGVNQYIKLPTLPFDGIHHLDMHMCVIDEETIIIGEYPDGISDGPQIEANIQYLVDSFQTAFGHPFNVVRIPMPPDANNRYPNQGGNYRTYTNSIFLNKTILVPTYQEKYDTTALRIYRENLPGYNVVGINCNSIIPQLGALHCITKTVGVHNPLWIAHSRLRDSDDPEREYPVSAIIKHREGIASAELYYRVSPDSVYTMVPMVLVDSAADQWAALIPAQTAGTEVQYYIHAIANNGQEQVRPIVAPQGYFHFRVLGEPANIPPTVSIVSPEDGAVFSIDKGLLKIVVEAENPDGDVPLCHIFINGIEDIVIGSDSFSISWVIPGEGNFTFYIEAEDEEGAIGRSDTLHITITESTGTTLLDSNKLFSVFPNPVSDMLHVTCGQYLPPPSISILDVQGNEVYKTSGDLNQGLAIDMSDLPQGIYFLSFVMDQRVVVYRVVKL